MIRLIAAVVMLAALATPASADTPTGRTLYVTHGRSNSVAVSTILASGDLRPVGEPVPDQPQPRGIVFSPNGSTAYLLNTAADSIASFRVGVKGELTAFGSPAGTGDDPFGIAVSPDGKAVYTANLDVTVSAFVAQQDGSLVPNGLPLTVDSDLSTRGIAVSPDGRFVFVSTGDPGDTRRGKLITYAVQPDYKLKYRSATKIGPGAFGIGITPDGRFLFVACSGSDEILSFKIGSEGGLTAVGAASAPDFPVSAVVSGDGRFLFAASPAYETGAPKGVWLFEIDRYGGLRPVGSAPAPAGGRPVWPAPTPDGRHLYVSNEDLSEKLFGFRMTGVLTPLPGSPFDARGLFSMFQSTAVRPNHGPVAAFDAGSGTPTQFDATGSSDPDGRIARYDWDFGDGAHAKDAGPTPRHTYAAPGRYRVTLIVTDNEGCSTKLVFTGQSALCNGSPAAAAHREVVVGMA